MVRLAGIDTVALLLERVTATPLLGAGPFKVTVPVALLPPATELGSTETETKGSGITVKLAGKLELLVEAVIVAEI